MIGLVVGKKISIMKSNQRNTKKNSSSFHKKKPFLYLFLLYIEPLKKSYTILSKSVCVKRKQEKNGGGEGMIGLVVGKKNIYNEIQAEKYKKKTPFTKKNQKKPPQKKTPPLLCLFIF